MGRTRRMAVSRQAAARSFVIGSLAFCFTSSALVGQEMCVLSGYPAQDTTSSCQSRFMAMGMGHRAPHLFPVTTALELQSLEQTVRAKLKEIAAGHGRTEPVHTDWQETVTELSSNNLKMTIAEFSSESALRSKLADLVGWTIGGKQPPPVTYPMQAKNLVGVSVHRIGDDLYPAPDKSHVVVVLSVDLLSGELVIANSWRKDAAGKAIREGHVVQTNEIEFKNFCPGQAKTCLRLYWIESK